MAKLQWERWRARPDSASGASEALPLDSTGHDRVVLRQTRRDKTHDQAPNDESLSDDMLNRAVNDETPNSGTHDPTWAAPAKSSLPPTPVHATNTVAAKPLISLRYRVQFTADQAYVDLLEQARDWLQHDIPSRDLGRVQRLAIEALIEKLAKRKYSAFSKGGPRTASSGPDTSPQTTTAASVVAEPRVSHASPAGQVAATAPVTTVTPTSFVAGAPSTTKPFAGSSAPAEPVPGPALVSTGTTAITTAASATTATSSTTATTNGRYISAAVRRTVWARDAGRCTYTDARGQRCRETSLLEFHHREPHAKGGPASLDNVTIYCRAHNQLAAERDFGRDAIESKKRGEPIERPHSEYPIRLSDVWTGAKAIEGYQTGCGAYSIRCPKLDLLPHLASLGGASAQRRCGRTTRASAEQGSNSTARHHNALALAGWVAVPNTLP